jgi:hypothetical protein
LTKALDCVPEVTDGQVGCECPNESAYVCISCGDQFCGAAENPCTCPADCQQGGDCVPGDTLPCNCQNNYDEEPACFECNELGEWMVISWFADPCECQHWTCGAGFACNPENGQCVPDCRISFACPTGTFCDDATGLCTPEGCLGEGMVFNDFDTEGKCCPGLVPIPEAVPENGTCLTPNCPCFVCTRCGDGECREDTGENRCNCPQDCVTAHDCTAESCMSVAGHYAVVQGDCPGIPYDPFVMYPVHQIPSCAPMEAYLAGGMCDTAWGFKWDGQQCVYLGGRCECVGADCDRLFPTQEECLAAHHHCMYQVPCEPMNCVVGDPDCDGTLGWQWDGAQCAPIGSGCDAICDYYPPFGAQMGYPTLEDCQVAHGHCTAQTCSLHFEGILGELLGWEGCIDHNIIFTSHGCYGQSSQVGCGISMYLTCPFLNENGDRETCTVTLDNMLDCK